MWQVFWCTASTRFTPARGARVALAMLPPLVGIAVLGHSRVGSNVAVGTLLGVLFVAPCDQGTSLRIRAQAMTVGSLVGALLVGLGSWIGGPWWVAMPALAVTTFLSGLLPLYGTVVAQMGTTLTVLVAFALGRGGGPATAVPTALGYLLGGILFLSLVFASSALDQLLHLVADAPRAAPTPAAAVATVSVPATGHVPLVRLAVLRAAGTALVAGAAWSSGIPYPQWAAIVVILSVRTDQMAALRLTTRRVVGTVLAAGLADVVLHVLPDPVVLAGLAVGSEFLAVTVQNVNFTAFVFFFTLTLLLLGRPTQGPEHAALRVATTVVGALVALAISALAAWLAQHPSSVPPPHSQPPHGAPGEGPP
jgi:uncharacterized membrane protein YccC